MCESLVGVEMQAEVAYFDYKVYMPEYQLTIYACSKQSIYENCGYMTFGKLDLP